MERWSVHKAYPSFGIQSRHTERLMQKKKKKKGAREIFGENELGYWRIGFLNFNLIIRNFLLLFHSRKLILQGQKDHANGSAFGSKIYLYHRKWTCIIINAVIILLGVHILRCHINECILRN